MMIFDRQRAEALAVVVAGIRPDWDAAGIIAALRTCAARGDTLGPVALAAIRAALNPRINTPAVIPLGGDHWRTSGATPPTLTPPTYDRQSYVLDRAHRGDYDAGAAAAKTALSTAASVPRAVTATTERTPR